MNTKQDQVGNFINPELNRIRIIASGRKKLMPADKWDKESHAIMSLFQLRSINADLLINSLDTKHEEIALKGFYESEVNLMLRLCINPSNVDVVPVSRVIADIDATGSERIVASTVIDLGKQHGAGSQTDLKPKILVTSFGDTPQEAIDNLQQRIYTLSRQMSSLAVALQGMHVESGQIRGWSDEK